jgi:hypothetical protein
MAGEEDMESDKEVGHKHMYSTLQNNVYKWTNIATCRLYLTNVCIYIYIYTHIYTQCFKYKITNKSDQIDAKHL